MHPTSDNASDLYKSFYPQPASSSSSSSPSMGHVGGSAAAASPASKKGKSGKRKLSTAEAAVIAGTSTASAAALKNLTTTEQPTQQTRKFHSKITSPSPKKQKAEDGSARVPSSQLNESDSEDSPDEDFSPDSKVTPKRSLEENESGTAPSSLVIVASTQLALEHELKHESERRRVKHAAARAHFKSCMQNAETLTVENIRLKIQAGLISAPPAEKGPFFKMPASLKKVSVLELLSPEGKPISRKMTFKETRDKQNKRLAYVTDVIEKLTQENEALKSTGSIDENTIMAKESLQKSAAAAVASAATPSSSASSSSSQVQSEETESDEEETEVKVSGAVLYSLAAAANRPSALDSQRERNKEMMRVRRAAEKNLFASSMSTAEALTKENIRLKLQAGLSSAPPAGEGPFFKLPASLEKGAKWARVTPEGRFIPKAIAFRDIKNKRLAYVTDAIRKLTQENEALKTTGSTGHDT